MPKRSNNGPRVDWHKVWRNDGLDHHYLYVNGRETPFFIWHGKVLAHRAGGSPYTVMGAGMGAEIKCRDGSSYRIAADLAHFSRMSQAKARAVQLALAD